MRAQLARHARRALIQQVRSPSCAVYSAPLRRRCTPRTINNGYSKRFFLDGLFAKAPRDIRQPEFEPGWQKIMIWRSRMLDNLRPPPTQELVHAWQSFFEEKLSSRMPLNGTQAMQCRRLLGYLLKEREFPNQSRIEGPDLIKALNALGRLRPRERTQDHLELARNLWSAINSSELHTKPDWTASGSLWCQYISVLCTFGGSKEALEMVYSNWDKVLEFCKKKTKNPILWLAEGLAREGYEEDLIKLATPNFKTIGEIIEMCEENQVLLEPETISSLCLRFLENEQHFEVMDILSVHAFQYSATEREVIQDAFTKFCIDGQTSTSRAWNGYQILRQFFQDLSFDHRVKLMEAFFDRKRPDMAAHVFGHMRQHRNSDYRPKRETYITFFERFSRCPDEESLEIVHNMLKMDTTVAPNTKLYTALLLAYAACGKGTQAMDFWQAITASQEGPSYASLEAVFWALERTPNGSRQAHIIWKRIESMDVDIPPSVFNAYVGAIAGSGEEEKAEDTIMRMGLATKGEPDAMTLGIAFNALPGQTLQANFKSWAQSRYPKAWADLESKGKRLNKDSLCQYKLNRILTA
ncbi:Complex I intermediate-associated mitochondrial [Fusarium acuminatum]|uniref:Complex I intermediate-associated mitochondrial n=1 Tax=Fusarium acuminatum TaxID=5515 RepID=A0ABZ2WSW2_9HYPO